MVEIREVAGGTSPSMAKLGVRFWQAGSAMMVISEPMGDENGNLTERGRKWKGWDEGLKAFFFVVLARTREKSSRQQPNQGLLSSSVLQVCLFSGELPGVGERFSGSQNLWLCLYAFWSYSV